MNQTDQEIEATISELFREAVRRRLWVTAAFFLLGRPMVRRAAHAATEAKPERKLSPFLYQLR